MKIEIRSDSVHIDGYVNAVGRDSRPIKSPKGDFVEMVEPGTFRAALDRAENVELQLNHGAKVLGSIKDGNLTLAEDSIGLRAQADITDAEVIEKARQGKLRGWSFGMTVNKCDYEERAEALPRRHLTDIDIFEVSLIDERMSPCYAGTSVECRAEGDILSETRANEEELEIIDTRAEDIDYSEWEQRIASLKVAEWEMRAAELRFNPYHDPTNGRFTDSTGGGMGGVLYSKGGKSAYVVNSDKFERNIIKYEPRTRGQITKYEAGVLYKNVKEGNVFAKPELISELYDATNDYIGNASWRYNQNSLYYDRVQRLTESLLNKNYNKSQNIINDIEYDNIMRAGKKSRWFKYQTAEHINSFLQSRAVVERATDNVSEWEERLAAIKQAGYE